MYSVAKIFFVCVLSLLTIAGSAVAQTNLSTAMSNGTGMTCTGTGGSLACSTGVPSATTSQLYGGTGTAGNAAAVSLGTALAISSGVLNTAIPINAQGTSNYTILSSDMGKLITGSNSTALAYTLPAAGGTGFGAGVAFSVANLGVGAITITPASGTIAGKGTLVLYQGMGVQLVSDGTNWNPVGLGVSPYNAQIAGGTLTGMTGVEIGSNATTNPLGVTYTGADGVFPALIDVSNSTIASSSAVRIHLTAVSSNLNGNVISIINGSDAISWFGLVRDISASGTTMLPGISMGPGGSSSRDTFLYRSATNELSLSTGGAYNDVAIKMAGTTSTNQQVAIAGAAYAGALNVNGTIKTLGYTVTTLPTGTIGMRAYVTDATACSINGTLTGSGSTFCPVIYNGSAWVGG